MGRYFKAARIVKARKRQGRLVVQCCDGLPFLLEEGMTVHIVPPSLTLPRTVVVREALEGDECLVSFEGIHEYSQLVEYVGRWCLVARDDVDGQLLARAPLSVAGLSVQDEAYGDLGQVAEVLDNGFQATLVIRGKRGEVLVPFVDEFVRELNPEAGLIRTCIPSGLVEG